MSKLPKARIVRVPKFQKQALARWLHEWRTDTLLRDAGDDAGFPGKQFTPFYVSEPVEAGQIRLFHPFSKETSAQLRYIAVLRGNRVGTWLVAPFGRFSEPALPGEWSTGRDTPALRTLCIWNSRLLQGSLLGRSWVVDTISTSAIRQALTIHSLLTEGRALPGSLARRIGPPLVHPLDPRLEYVEEEKEWFAALSTSPASNEPLNSAYDIQESEKRSLPLAAEKRENYRTSKDRRGKRRLTGGDQGKCK